METCAACNKLAYEPIKYCPYCGKASATPAIAPQQSRSSAASDLATLESVAYSAGVSKANPGSESGSNIAHGQSVSNVSPAQKGQDRAAAAQGQGPATPLQKQPTPTKAKSPAEPSVAKTSKQSPPEKVSESTKKNLASEANGQSPSKSGSKGLLSGLVAMILVVIYMIGTSSKKDDPCDSALSAAAQKLAFGEAAAARDMAGLALVACSGDARAKAVDLQAAANKAIAALALCEVSFRTITSLIGDHRLQSASNALDRLNTDCAKSVQANDLRQQVERGQSATVANAIDVSRLISEGDFKGARTVIDQMMGSNREHPNLSGLLNELMAADKAVATAPSVDTTLTQTPNISPQQPVPTAAPSPGVNQHPDLVLAFLRDAEQAMQQLKFDAAKTYVESARRIDPNNLQAADALRRIRERELQYLKDETTIK